MNSLFVILKLGIREKIRERLFLLPFLLSFFVILLSFFFAELSIGDPERVVTDFALSLLALLSAIFVIVNVTQSIDAEVKNQTCLLVLARPISRDSYIVAKYLSVLVLTALMFFLPFLALSFLTKLGFSVFISYFGMISEAFVLASIGICLAQFVRPVFAMILTFSVWSFALLLPEIAVLLKEQRSAQLGSLVQKVTYLTPQLYRFQYHSFESLIGSRDFNEHIFHFAHTMVWTGLMLWIACQKFRNRDLV